MPSGSHGGSRGSHSSGGSRSSSSGSSFGGRSSGRYHHGPRFVFWGRAYPSGKFSAFAAICMIFIMISFIAMFAGFAIIPGEKKEINKIKEDYEYYQEIIALGNITTAKVTDVFSNAGRYYITYSIDLPNSYFDLEGYSYSVYSRSEAIKLLSQGTIEVALNKPLNEADLKTDSVPTDYKDMPLTNDGEYVGAVKGLKSARICAYVGLAQIVIGIIVLVVIHKKAMQTTKQQVDPTTVNQTTNGEQYSNCPHCGCRVKPHQDSCSACGSKLK